MAWFRKVKAGLVKEDIAQFVGEEGNIFFNVETGEIRLSDGVTPGGLPVAGGGGAGGNGLQEISTIDENNNVLNPILLPDTLRFDDRNFKLTNLGSGDVKIELTSTSYVGNLDGGSAFSDYGGLEVIDAGGI